jgi:chemotaxis signal transduction protein
MKVDQPTAGKVRPRRAEQMILFRIGNQVFAISANAVQEVRSSDTIAGAGADLPHSELRKVRHVVKRNQRTIYVVHGGTHFGLAAAQSALVFLLRNQRVALLVDAIDRMASFTSLQALPEAFSNEERDWYRGLVTLENAVIPVVNPDGLLRPNEIALLDAATQGVADEPPGKDTHSRSFA